MQHLKFAFNCTTVDGIQSALLYFSIASVILNIYRNPAKAKKRPTTQTLNCRFVFEKIKFIKFIY